MNFPKNTLCKTILRGSYGNIIAPKYYCPSPQLYTGSILENNHEIASCSEGFLGVILYSLCLFISDRYNYHEIGQPGAHTQQTHLWVAPFRIVFDLLWALWTNSSSASTCTLLKSGQIYQLFLM